MTKKNLHVYLYDIWYMIYSYFLVAKKNSYNLDNFQSMEESKSIVNS